MSLTSTASTHEVLNIDELLARCLGNISFATRILAKFQDRFEEDLVELDKALLAQDAEAVARIAHRIKGASANVAAAQLHESSAEIEQSGRAGVCRTSRPALIDFARSGRASWTTHPRWNSVPGVPVEAPGPHVE